MTILLTQPACRDSRTSDKQRSSLPDEIKLDAAPALAPVHLSLGVHHLKKQLRQKINTSTLLSASISVSVVKNIVI
jgi:hypothetical protein